MDLFSLAKFLNEIDEGSRYALLYKRERLCKREGSTFSCNLLFVSSHHYTGRRSLLSGSLL